MPCKAIPQDDIVKTQEEHDQPCLFSVCVTRLGRLAFVTGGDQLGFATGAISGLICTWCTLSVFVSKMGHLGCVTAEHQVGFVI